MSRLHRPAFRQSGAAGPVGAALLV